MGHMEVVHLEDTCWREIIKSEVTDLWIHWAGGVVLMDFILALVLRDIITITATIIIGGVRRDILLWDLLKGSKHW